MRRSFGVRGDRVRATWRIALLAVVASVIPAGIALGAGPTGPLVIDNFNPSTATASGQGSFSASGGVGTVTVPFSQSATNCETLKYSYASAQNLTAVSSQIELDFSQITSTVPTGNNAFDITVTLTDSNNNASTQSTGIGASGSAGIVALPYNESGDKFTGNADLTDIRTIQVAFCSPSNRSSGSSTIRMTEIQADGLPPVVNKIAVTGPTAPTVGQATSYTVTAQDSSGNTVTSDNDQVDISISNGTVPGTAQLSSGVASFQATFGAGGSQSITVTDGAAGASGTLDVTVAKLSQVIDFPAPAGGSVGGGESLSATGGGSGNAVVFSVDTADSSPADACSVSGTNGTKVSFAHAGTCVIDADQSGNDDFDAAPELSRTVTVAKASQAVDFPAPGGGTVGGSESLSGTGGGSGNPVVFSVDTAASSPADACSVSGTNGTTLSFAHAGSCVIDASQSGNDDFDAAPQVSRTVTVTAPPTPPTQPVAPSAPAPAPTAPAAPAATPLTISAIKVTALTITWCKHCAYPNTRLNFSLSAGGDVRLKLLAKTDGRWKQVAVTTLHAHRGNNSFRIAGRWGGQLVPRRTIRLLVHVKRGTTWKPIRTLTLTVDSPYTTKILDRH